MDGVDAQPMSAGELKARLYHTFRERGLVESLKSQLRTKLVTELRQSAALQQVKFGPSHTAGAAAPSLDGSSSLMLRAANSLVADHLRRCGYDYSMAVFLPESGSAEDKVFTVPDLLDLMRITPGSRLHTKLSTDLPRYDSKGFLWQLLSELSAGWGVDQRHAGVQVESHPAHQSSIERKLQSVDEEFSQQSEEDGILGRHSVQEKLLKMRREMEVKTREEINREIHRFKESELKRVELEEREKARKEIASARREIENTYQAKSDALREREHATMDRIQKHQELIERETYAQRQSLLDELRVIKQREADMRREADVNSRAAKMEEDKRKAVEDNLKLREASVANIETTYEKRLKEETKRFQLDYEARVSQRLSELEQREAKIRADHRSISEERETMKSLQEQLAGKARHILELEDLLKQAKSEAASAVNRSELLNERMRTMVDYPSLKEDNTILRRDLEHAKMRIAELSGDFKSEQTRHEDLIKQLSEKMSRPSPELLALRSELEQAREQLHHEKATIQHMESQWKARLQEEMEANRELRHRLSEQTNEMASLMRQLSDLKLALRQTQTALNNNIHHPSRAGGIGIENTALNSTLGDDLYIDTSLHRTTLGPGLLLAESGRYRSPPPDDDDSGSGDDDSESRGGDSMAVIERTKARFRELEREAEHLEQNYQDLQHRMSGVGGLYSSPLQAGGGTPAGPLPRPLAGAPRHAGASISGLPEHDRDLPVDGGRGRYADISPGSPGQHSGVLPSGFSEPGAFRLPPYHAPQEGQGGLAFDGDGGQSTSDQRNTESLLPGKMPLSPLSSSSASSVSRGLREPHSRPTGPGGNRGEEKTSTMLPRQQEESLSRAGVGDEQERRRVERETQERERQIREERRLKEEEEEEERRREEQRRREDERRADEARRERERLTDADEEGLRRRRQEEEEEEAEQRAWEEKRRKKEEERRRKEQEAREREQRMLMELQKQEQQSRGGASSAAADTTKAKHGARASDHDATAPDAGQKVGEKEKEEDAGGEEGIKIDPMMQRYMMMVQQRKQREGEEQPAAAPAAREPLVIPDSPSLSVKSVGSLSAGELEGEMDDEPASAGNVSDKDDPFGDW